MKVFLALSKVRGAFAGFRFRSRMDRIRWADRVFFVALLSNGRFAHAQHSKQEDEHERTLPLRPLG